MVSHSSLAGIYIISDDNVHTNHTIFPVIMFYGKCLYLVSLPNSYKSQIYFHLFILAACI